MQKNDKKCVLNHDFIVLIHLTFYWKAQTKQKICNLTQLLMFIWRYYIPYNIDYMTPNYVPISHNHLHFYQLTNATKITWIFPWKFASCIPIGTFTTKKIHIMQNTLLDCFWTYVFVNGVLYATLLCSSLLKTLLLIIYSPPCHPRCPCLSFFSRKEFKVFD